MRQGRLCLYLRVCSGFIDVHSHSDLPLVVNPTADSKVMQGVTLEVIGQCGSSGAPRNSGIREQEDDTAREAGIEGEPGWRVQTGGGVDP